MNNEPVAWITMSGLSYQQTGLNDRPLYTHPAKTLTDEEIIQIVSEKLETWNTKEAMIDFARAILRKAQEK